MVPPYSPPNQRIVFLGARVAALTRPATHPDAAQQDQNRVRHFGTICRRQPPPTQQIVHHAWRRAMQGEGSALGPTGYRSGARLRSMMSRIFWPTNDGETGVCSDAANNPVIGPLVAQGQKISGRDFIGTRPLETD